MLALIMVNEKASRILPGYPNLYVDCSSSFKYIDKETATLIIERYGTDRVLFGTDFPMWRADREIEILLSLGFGKEDYKKMFSGNAKKIYNI